MTTTTWTITEPGVYDLPAEVYHADPVEGGSLSSTGARKLLPPSCPGWHVTTATGAACHIVGRHGNTRCGREIHRVHEPGDRCTRCAKCGIDCPDCGGTVPRVAGRPVPHRVQIVTRDGVRDSAHLCPGGQLSTKEPSQP